MKKLEANTTPMFGYTVNITSECHESTRSGKRFGSWSESWGQTLDNLVTKAPSGQHPDIVSSLDIPPGSNALVVWVIYSTGDSFGRSEGGQTEVLGIFLDMNSAVELKKHIESTDSRESGVNPIKFTTSDGQTFSIDYAPWAGYFESLDSVKIDVVTVF